MHIECVCVYEQIFLSYWRFNTLAVSSQVLGSAAKIILSEIFLKFFFFEPWKCFIYFHLGLFFFKRILPALSASHYVSPTTLCEQPQMKRGLAFNCMCTLASHGENVLKDSLWMSGVSVHHCGIIKTAFFLMLWDHRVWSMTFYEFHWLWVIYLYIPLTL